MVRSALATLSRASRPVTPRHNLAAQTLGAPVTPAMEAGLTDHVWSVEELIVAALDAYEAPPPMPPAVVLAPPPKGASFGRRPTNNGPLPGQLRLPGVE